MNADAIYEHLERIANLIRTDIRKAGISFGLQPIQMEALHYLSRCNRYSNTPVAVADFLGLTKGTVSQTLGVLEANGLIEKQTDLKDRRVIHLVLTEKGEHLVRASIPPSILHDAVRILPEAEYGSIAMTLNRILRALQTANGMKTFGACKSCRHHLLEGSGMRRCNLTTEILSERDADRICREHDPPAAASS